MHTTTPFLFGTAYYHEYHPVERLDEDIRLLLAAGINCVRLGESTWTLWEPRDGQYEFAWIDRVIDAMHAAGIRVILGTPTYSHPAWMHRLSPETTRTNLDGRPEPFGYRMIADLGSPSFRHYCERLLRVIVPRYKDHPAVIGWQIDNETDTFGLAGGPRLEALFRERLKQKFGTPEKLSEAWGLTYWSRNLHDWADLFPRQNTPFPQHKLEWERFIQDYVTDFVIWQAGLVRSLKGEQQFITHDFSCVAFQDVRMRDIAQAIDHVGINPYDHYQDACENVQLNAYCDVARPLSARAFLVTETGAGIDGAGGFFPPYPGQLRLNAWSFAAAGASAVLYWHWHSLHYGAEQTFCGIIPHDYVPGRIYAEVARVGAEFARLGPVLLGARREERVAVLHDLDTHYALKHEPIRPQLDYHRLFTQATRALHRLHAGHDVLLSLDDLRPHHAILVVPSLYLAPEASLEKLAAFVARGGHLVLGCKSGYADEFMRVRWTPQPGGPLRALCGVGYQEKAALPSPVPLVGPLADGLVETPHARLWAELLDAAPGTEVLARYDHPFYGAHAALVRRRHESGGSATYLGCDVENPLLARVLGDTLALADLASPAWPETLRVRHATAADGARLTFYLNQSGTSLDFTHHGLAGRDLISERDVSSGSTLHLAPWDVALIHSPSD
jgi:beta-galactosidase